MEKRTFCTIITKSHLRFAHALHYSYNQFEAFDTKVLVVDSDKLSFDFEANDFGVKYYFREDIEGEYADEFYRKYFLRKKIDHYRWAMKSVFINSLISEGYTKVIYVDSDLFFYKNPAFLFDELNQNSMLLTPQHHRSDPFEDKVDFLRNFKHGHFNAGFVACNGEAVAALNWWAKMCLYKMERNAKKSLFDDQGYLDLMPMLFEGVKIMFHKGCNVSFNPQECQRVMVNGEMMINGKYPVIFLHFRKDAIKAILDGRDPLLQAHLNDYLLFFKGHYLDFDFMSWIYPEKRRVLARIWNVFR